MVFKRLKNVLFAVLVMLAFGVALAQGVELVVIPQHILGILLGGGIVAGLASVTMAGLSARPWWKWRDDANAIATVALGLFWALFFRFVGWMPGADGFGDVIAIGVASGVFAAFGYDWLTAVLKPEQTTVVAVTDGDPDVAGVAELVEAVDDAKQ